MIPAFYYWKENNKDLLSNVIVKPRQKALPGTICSLKSLKLAS
jgi:hypothetical protein